MTSKSVELSAYEVKQGVTYLTGGKVCVVSHVEDQFPAAKDLESIKPWPSVAGRVGASMSLPYNSNADVMELLYSNMAARIRLSADLAVFEQRSRRELISPVLFAAAALARTHNLRIAAEYAVQGERAHGSIDWVYLYKHLAVVVCEASATQYTSSSL